MGIRVIGSRGPCRPLILGTRCMVSALHPALVQERRGGHRRSGGAELYRMTRGFSLATYTATEGTAYQNEVPDQRTVDMVLRIWDARKSVPLAADADVWAFAPERLSMPSAVAPAGRWAEATDDPPQPPPATDPPPPNEEQLRAARQKWQQQREAMEARAQEKLAVLRLLPETVLKGDRFGTLLHMMGVPVERENWPARASAFAPAGQFSLPPIVEVPCYGSDWDPNGGVWGRPGDFPPWWYVEAAGAKARRASIARPSRMTRSSIGTRARAVGRGG